MDRQKVCNGINEVSGAEKKLPRFHPMRSMLFGMRGENTCTCKLAGTSSLE